MKKVFAAVCTLALAFGLAGCSSGGAQESQEEASQPIQGQTDEASVAKARELMEALINAPQATNYTESSTITTATVIEGQEGYQEVAEVKMLDINGDDVRAYIQTETQPEAESDAIFYIHNTDGVREVKDEKVAIELSQDYVDSLANPQDNSATYQSYYDSTQSIAYAQNDGSQVVQLIIDPQKLAESGILSDAFQTIDSCIAEYTFDDEGSLISVISTISGTVANDDGSTYETTIERKSLYTNRGTTEVPELPEVD